MVIRSPTGFLDVSIEDDNGGYVASLSTPYSILRSLIMLTVISTGLFVGLDTVGMVLKDHIRIGADGNSII